MASVFRRPDGKWRARYRDPEGREHARHFDRKVDAEGWVATMQADIARGTYLDPAAGQTTFTEHANRWLEQQPHRSGTSRLYQRTLRLHVYPVIGGRQLRSLRRSDVQGLASSLAAAGYAPKTVENVLRLVRAILHAAVDDGLIPVTPYRKITLPTVDDRHIVPRDLDAVRRAAELISPRLRALVLLSVGTGLRQGEALGVTVDRIDFLRREVLVDRQLVKEVGHPPRLGPLKTASSKRVVPLPAFVVEGLSTHLATFGPGEGGLVFSGGGGQPVARAWLHRAWRAAIASAGLPSDTTWHMLRHTYASILIDGGESVTVVARRLGHANPTETLKTYSHLWPDSDDRTRQVVETAFANHVNKASRSGNGLVET